MKILLRDFQIEAVNELVEEMHYAAGEARRNRKKLQAVSLSSPTGSGKTMMMTAAIERILAGDEEHGPNPEATFLWITDQPELNEQTRRKMLATSSILGAAAHLEVVDTTFDAERFAPGRVYFLNTQKLGRNSTLIAPGDKRTFTIWETISQTAQERPGDFFVLIDEAHRGMGQSAHELNQAQTIIQKFIKGSAGEIPPIPLIVGISATPRRFDNLVQGTTRTARPVVIPPENVRASGLIKEIITFWHPTESQPSDMTMLQAAAKSWREYRSAWAAYCEAQQETPPVRPLLTVQVQDAAARQSAVSQTDIAAVLRAIEEENRPLPASAYAHAFQEKTPITVDGREIRYLSPPDIDSDPDVQIVFFKTSLNTGWDCPRAEVMMSFRKAEDATLIAQLVGRMVRTPLARRIDTNEHLNTVALYLPHYNEAELNKVVERLTTPDSELMPPTTFQHGAEAVTLQRAEGSEAAFAALSKLPSYVVPRNIKPNEIRRLMKLGRCLSKDGLKPDAPETATRTLMAVLRAQFERVKDTEEFEGRVQERDTLDVRVVNHLLYESFDAGKIETLTVSPENVNDLFEAAGRRLGEGLHKEWWRTRVTEEGCEKSRAKLEICVLCMDSSLKKTLEAEARKQVKSWFTLYGEQIKALPEGKRQAYEEIRGLASEPEETTLEFPQMIEGSSVGPAYKRHLYVDGGGDFHMGAKETSWEAAVIAAETARTDIVGWLRCVDRKPWALRVPYRYGDGWHSLYPDFLVLRATPAGIVTDIIDPHTLSLADAPAKTVGLAQFAEKHGAAFGRIESIIVEDGEIKRLDLQNNEIREKAQKVRTAEQLEALFRQYAL